VLHVCIQTAISFLFFGTFAYLNQLRTVTDNVQASLKARSSALEEEIAEVQAKLEEVAQGLQYSSP
jgi:uncharacterized protein YceH (UPF0502 family)